MRLPIIIASRSKNKNVIDQINQQGFDLNREIAFLERCRPSTRETGYLIAIKAMDLIQRVDLYSRYAIAYANRKQKKELSTSKQLVQNFLQSLIDKETSKLKTKITLQL